MESILSTAFAAALELLESRASEQGFLDLLEQVYGATGSDDAAFAAAASSLQQLLSSGSELGIQVKSLDGADMNGAMGAYSSTGVDGMPVIYINTSLLSEGADPELLQRVLLEEIGHHFDILLNGSVDTAGDEGELFADLISGDTLTLDQQSTITTQSDAGTVLVDGQTVAVEQAAIAAPTSTTLGATGTTQTINRAAATAISLSLTFDAGNNAGSDILVAAFNGTNLIGWTIYDRSADLDAGTGQTTRAITVSFNLAQFNTNVSTGSLSFRYWQGSAAGTVGNDNLSVTQSGTSTAPFRVNSNSQATITTNITLTTNLPGGQSATWTNTTLDVIAPSASLTGATIPNTGSVTVQSSETGTAYLVNSNVNVTNLTSITAAANNQWNSVTISAANTNTSLSAAGLEDGTYKLYTVDAAGNLSSASSNSVTVDTTAPTV
ncbi:MAG: hypothetical protein ACK55H_03910, partial [Cyanobacteriota bacterium]